jgi:probable O-glycosylation ligase (exosortase A-associated)
MTLLVCALLAAPLLPDRLWERIQSIGEQESEETRDQSSQNRIQAWRTAWNIAIDRPFTGAGFRALWNEDIWAVYSDSSIRKGLDAHSLYFEVLSEHGFMGFALYFVVLGSTLITLRRIRKRWRGHADHGYLANYAEMTQLCLYPFLVAGAFIGVAYFDLYFYFVAASVALRSLSDEAEKAVVPAPLRVANTKSAVPASTAVPARATRGSLRSPRNRHA